MRNRETRGCCDLCGSRKGTRGNRKGRHAFQHAGHGSCISVWEFSRRAASLESPKNLQKSLLIITEYSVGSQAPGPVRLAENKSTQSNVQYFSGLMVIMQMLLNRKKKILVYC